MNKKITIQFLELTIEEMLEKENRDLEIAKDLLIFFSDNRDPDLREVFRACESIRYRSGKIEALQAILRKIKED